MTHPFRARLADVVDAHTAHDGSIIDREATLDALVGTVEEIISEFVQDELSGPCTARLKRGCATSSKTSLTKRVASVARQPTEATQRGRRCSECRASNAKRKTLTWHSDQTNSSRLSTNRFTPGPEQKKDEHARSADGATGAIGAASTGRTESAAVEPTSGGIDGAHASDSADGADSEKSRSLPKPRRGDGRRHTDHHAPRHRKRVHV